MKLLSITSFHEKYSDIASVPFLRKLVFNEHTNGFHRVVVRVGRKVLLDEDQFFKWVAKQNKSSKVKKA